MSNGPLFPHGIDTDATLFVAVNNKRTTLTASITDSDLVIPVASTAGFPDSGFITILSDPTDITQAEAIEYSSITPTSFIATQRGAGGTPALPHNAGDNVDLTVVAAHHNVLKDAIIELEFFVGVSGSENFPRFTPQQGIVIPGQINSNVIVVNTATVSGALTATSGAFSQSLTISGVPASIGIPTLIELDDRYVNTIGDSMTGNLDMQANNIYNVGVVAMQPEAPVLVTSGLLWFDTDAPGPSDGNAGLPGGFLGALVAPTSGTSLANNSWEVLEYKSTVYDKGGWVDAGLPTRLIVPSGVKNVRVVASQRYASSNVGGRHIEIFKNGDANVALPPDQGVVASTAVRANDGDSHVHIAVSPVLPVVFGDYFEVRVKQTSGGALTAETEDTWFGIQAVDTRGVPGVNSLNLLQGDISLVAGSGILIASDSVTNNITVTVTGSVGGGGGGIGDTAQIALIAQVFGS